MSDVGRGLSEIFGTDSLALLVGELMFIPR